jgi:hypothetical protein
MPLEILEIEQAQAALQRALDTVLRELGAIRIGDGHQFPSGWRKAGKGRTVWRLVEEAIVQNLELQASELGLASVTPAASEVGVYDVAIELELPRVRCFLNIKAAADGGRAQKDDISKARGLVDFYEESLDRELFVATVYLKFDVDEDALLVTLVRDSVFPVAWIPDIYVNPSNNGNLQSSRYRNLSDAFKRTNAEFLSELKEEVAKADRRRLGQ